MSQSAKKDDEFICTCNPCLCDEPPPGLPKEVPKDETCICEEEPCECPPEVKEPSVQKQPSQNEFTYKHYKLNEFMRAKQLLKLSSLKSGQSLYDHLASVIVKALDFFAPSRSLNFIEEISLNVKRYRFNEDKDSLNDYFHMSKVILSDASFIVDNWTQNIEQSISLQDIPEGEAKFMSSFPSFQKFMVYLEKINVGLSQEEVFRLALSIRQLYLSRKYIERVRFFGKVFGTHKPYYVVEAEMKNLKAAAEEAWIPKPSSTARYFRKIQKMATEKGEEEQVTENEELIDSLLGAGDTFERAGKAVTNVEILIAYQNTSGGAQANHISPLTYTAQFPTADKAHESKKDEQGMVAAAMDALNFTFDDPDAVAEQTKWEEYQLELMTDFPVATFEEDEAEIPVEEGTGINRRCFYVCNKPGDKWTLLPSVTPQQINYTRNARWYLTGNLNAKVKCYPKFPGREGHYLRALLARITAGSQVSPKGYYKTSKTRKIPNPKSEDDDEDEEEDEDEDEDRDEGDDTIYPNVRFEPPKMTSLLDPSLELWCHHTSCILPQGRVVWWRSPQMATPKRQKGSDDESSEDDEEYEGEDAEPRQEIGPALFSSLVEDQCHFGKYPWTPRAAYTIFQDFQIAGVQSNVWPGATAICTPKGKAENIYIGDGLKFLGRSYGPSIPFDLKQEYPADGPELKEMNDPSVEEEQNWLAKLQLLEIADIEDKFVDNEAR